MSETTASLRHARALYQAGDLAGAETACRLLAERAPDDPEVTHLRGVLTYARGDAAAAVVAFAAATAARPERADWSGHLAQALLAAGDPGRALAAVDGGLGRAPLDGALSAIRAQCLKASGDKAQALFWYKKALAINPGDPSALWNMANLLVDVGRTGEGRAILSRLAETLPETADLWNNLAFAAYEDGDPAASLAACDRALTLAADHAEAHLNRAHALLALGRYGEGWVEYEWRLRRPGLDRPTAIPRWRGEDIAGKTILIHAEQGLGDAIQFVRFVSEVKARGATVVVEAPRALIPLFAGVAGVDRLIARQGRPLPDVAADVHCPLPSLPLALGKESADDLGSTAYLKADPSRRALWTERLRAAGAGRGGGPVVGLAWRGNPDHPRDALRSLPDGALEALSGVGGATFVSLQTPGAAKEPPALAMIDFGADLDRDAPFLDTAALIMSLDLVIAVDSAVNHLAGALGGESWTLLARGPDWRWGMTGDRSPWYPKARLFRQTAEGDWNGVMAEVVAALNARARRDGNPNGS